jgi:hypothetical protein
VSIDEAIERADVLVFAACLDRFGELIAHGERLAGACRRASWSTAWWRRGAAERSASVRNRGLGKMATPT